MNSEDSRLAMTDSNWKPVPHGFMCRAVRYRDDGPHEFDPKMQCTCSGTRWHGYGERVGDLAGVWALTGWLAQLSAPVQPAAAQPVAVPDGTEPATDDAPAYVTLSEHSAECALNALVKLSEENRHSVGFQTAARVIGPIVSDLRIALCRPWKPSTPPASALSPAPCRQCGYNGQGYYQPESHQCAATAAQEKGS